MFRHVLALLLLGGCGATPEQLLTPVGGVGVTSIVGIHRSPFDALYSLATGRNCSIVRLDRGQPYCVPRQPPPAVPQFCTRSLGVVDCWIDATRLPSPQRQVADGPRVLTEQQEAERTRSWPE